MVYEPGCWCAESGFLARSGDHAPPCKEVAALRGYLERIREACLGYGDGVLSATATLALICEAADSALSARESAAGEGAGSDIPPIDYHEFERAVNNECTCGGLGPEDGACHACMVWHRATGQADNPEPRLPAAYRRARDGRGGEG